MLRWPHVGEIIGFTNTTSSTGSKYICILLQNLSYIPSVQPLAGTNSPSRKCRYAEAASLFSSSNASPQSPSAAATPVLSPSQISSSSVTNIGKHRTPFLLPLILIFATDTDVDDTPLKRSPHQKVAGREPLSEVLAWSATWWRH